MNFHEALNEKYWVYQEKRFPELARFFERPKSGDRPPVFLKSEEGRNVLSNRGAGGRETARLLALIPKSERHTWFRSMNSSQALAQSILGNLAISGRLSALAELRDDEGESLFGAARLHVDAFSMEYAVGFLGELAPRITKIDGFISGDYRVAIECKFTEPEVGSCSRPRLVAKDSNYERDYCDKTYSVQRGRRERCSLTEVGIRYWEFVPQLFSWSADVDLRPCPLRTSYQLVRNILAATARADGGVSGDKGHAVLIYDARNPAFGPEGEGTKAYTATRKALLNSSMLRRCSWQRLVGHLRGKDVLGWLTEELGLKYGL